MRLNIPHLTINETVLEVKDVVKDLGVMVDCNLTFKCQINQMIWNLLTMTSLEDTFNGTVSNSQADGREFDSWGLMRALPHWVPIALARCGVSFLNDHVYGEAVWCEVLLQGNRILIGVVYRPPASNRESNDLLNDMIRLSGNYNSSYQVLICGDFNFSGIEWERNEVYREGQNVIDAQKFLDATNDCFLLQHVGEATHNIDQENPTRLDLIFTRNENDIENLQYCPPIGKSPHATLLFDLVVDNVHMTNVNKGNLKYKLCFHKGSYGEIKRELSDVNWQSEFEERSAKNMNETLVTILNRVISKNVPKRENEEMTTRPKWITKKVKKQINAKEKAWKKLRKRRTRLNKMKYQTERNKCTHLVRQAKLEFNTKVCEDIKTNPKHFWSYVRSKTTLKDEYGGPVIEDIGVTVKAVEKHLRLLNENKAMGQDGIHPKLLKVQQRISTTNYIDNKGVIENWNAIVLHLENNNLISDSQHGFRQGRSTLTNLLTYTEYLSSALDQQVPVDVVYLDCKRAFDTVPHERLLTKLEAYGIRGNLWRWCGSLELQPNETKSLNARLASTLVPVTSFNPVTRRTIKPRQGSTAIEASSLYSFLTIC
ncbi:uncharacterized protein LOC143032672 [Oratosquilla oratoria]|uniref:uncharacterized protein LOC143032672 n=1 Tax=Oratosquilla oratoria TaxID=337810 RepID=UPI003F7766CD